jgi:hypothetical protein
MEDYSQAAEDLRRIYAQRHFQLIRRDGIPFQRQVGQFGVPQ